MVLNLLFLPDSNQKKTLYLQIIKFAEHLERNQMTSELQQNNNQNILKGLQSADSIRVIETLEELRISGKVSDIPFLIELLHLNPEPEIKSKIIDLFANLKESDAIPLIVEAIQNQKYAPELKELVACCWENGLDYSNYLSIFVNLLIESDFVVAFEAYTVIVNMIAKIEQSKIDSEIGRLENAIHIATDQKKELMREVVDFLPTIVL